MINKTNIKQLRYVKLLTILSLSVLQVVGLNKNQVFAQNNIVPDETLGNEKSRVVPFEGNSAIDTIQGGAIRDSNLFHSFREFNVSENGSAYFANPEGITDIFSRVTGNNPSNIFGKLGVLGDANLFLINPNGIVFGENASLDLQGSFVATTANGIGFGEQGVFSASNPEVPRLLNVSPSAFLFNQIAAQPIVNRSIVANSRNTSITDGLRVPDGSNLLLLGGDIILDGGFLNAVGGKIEIGGLAAPGVISLNIDGNNLDVTFPDNVEYSDILLQNQAFINTSGVGGGEIQIQGNNFTVKNNSNIFSFTSGDRNGKGINIKATQLDILEGSTIQAGTQSTGNSGNISIETRNLNVSNGGQISASSFNQGAGGNLEIDADTVEIIGVSTNRLFSSALFTETSGVDSSAKAGNITLNSRTLNIRNGAVISTQTFNQGKGGNLTLIARESLNISGAGTLANGYVNRSGLFTSTQGSGTAGNLKIFDTGIIKIEDGGAILASTFNQGNGGNIEINADILELIGVSTNEQLPSALVTETSGVNSSAKAGDITLNSRILNLRDGAVISTQTFNQGKGGDLTLIVRESLNINGNAALPNNQFFRSALSTSTIGSGDAGNLKIFDTGIIKIEDGGVIIASTIAQGAGGNIEINADILELIGVSAEGQFPTGLGSETSGVDSSANAGNVTLNTRTLNIRDGAVLSTQSVNQGKAGNIAIQNRDRIQLTNGNILSTSQQSSGGAINITAQNIRLFGDSDIATNVFSGEGGGGNINLTANTIIALDDSDILSFAGDGKGGDITFNTEAFFSKPLYNPSSSTNSNANALTELDNNNRVDVNASGTVSGTITGIPDTTFIQDSLTELPENQIDTNVLVASSCIVRNNQQNGTFFVTGAGGLPINPSDAPLSNYSTGSVQSIPMASEKLPSSTTQNSWKIGDPIVEPSGAYQLPNGKILLSRECSN